MFKIIDPQSQRIYPDHKNPIPIISSIQNIQIRLRKLSVIQRKSGKRSNLFSRTQARVEGF